MNLLKLTDSNGSGTHKHGSVVLQAGPLVFNHPDSSVLQPDLFYAFWWYVAEYGFREFGR